MTSGQETERVHSYNPGARTGPGGTVRPKFNKLEMVTIFTYTDPVWLRPMHAISSYRGNRPHKQTHRQDRLQYTAPLSLVDSVITSLLGLFCPTALSFHCHHA